MKKVRKRLLALSLTAAMTALVVWQAGGEMVFAQPGSVKSNTQQEEKAKSDLEIARRQLTWKPAHQSLHG